MTTPETKRDVALKPCPFCGHVGVSIFEGSTFRWRVAGCDDCGAQTGEVRIQTSGEGSLEEWNEKVRADCIEAWNTRATLAPETQKGETGSAVAEIEKEAGYAPSYEPSLSCAPRWGYDVVSKDTALRHAKELDCLRALRTPCAASGGEAEPVAWLIEYGPPDDRRKFVERHNALADFRELHPTATSTPLYASQPADAGTVAVPVETKK